MSGTNSFLNEAISDFQAELPHIGKDSTADTGKYKYKYVDLTALHEIVFPLLAKHGLIWVTAPAVSGDSFVLRYSLTHAGSNEAVTGEWPLPPVSVGSQALGSAVTYARRYALIAVLGLAPGGEDDDGKAASTPPQAAKAVAEVGTPPEGWRKALEAVKDLDGLQALYDDSAHNWYTDEVKLAFRARKAALTA